MTRENKPTPLPQAVLGGGGEPPIRTAVGAQELDPQEEHSVLTRVRQRIENHGYPPFSPALNSILSVAQVEARALGASVLGVEHVVLGLMFDKEMVAILKERNPKFDAEKVRDVVKVTLGNEQTGEPKPNPTEALRVDAEVVEILWDVAEEAKKKEQAETDTIGIWNASSKRMNETLRTMKRAATTNQA